MNRILVVDDSTINIKIITASLAPGGYESEAFIGALNRGVPPVIDLATKPMAPRWKIAPSS
jgi:CheY-like chemotaxis protein